METQNRRLIDGHIIFENLMTEGGWVLDAGCRHFKLSKTLGNKFTYLCLDPDPIIESLKNVIFRPYALMTKNGTTNYCGWSTGEGNFCYHEKPDYATVDLQVTCRTLKNLMIQFKIKQFELIKLDIEGAEYDILLSITEKVSKQIAVEFHQALGYNKYGTHEEYIEKLMNSEFGKIYKIAEWYENQDSKGLYEYSFVLKN